MIKAVGIVAAALALLGAGSAQALTLNQVGPVFDKPMYVTSDPGNANRLFVVEREGKVQVVENGVATEFADLSSRVKCDGSCEGERGLASIALSPDFDTSGRLYADYADDVDGTIHVDELIAPGPEHATAAFAESLLEVEHPDAANHNGGQLQIGPDGGLYVSTGDGGGGDDQFHNAQDPASELGKILRIDPEAAPPSYSIWSYGLRNPYRFSFDALSGDMIIGDVGQGLREEVDLAPSPAPGLVGGEGANYGWNCREGLIAGPQTDPECVAPPPAGFVEPVFDYTHSPDPDFGGEGRCAITGGYVVRDAALGGLYGHYVYSDYCSGVLRALQLPADAGGQAGGDCALGLQLNHPVSFGEDSADRIYAIEQSGRVYRLLGEPPPGCPAAPLPPQPAPAQPQLDPTFIGIKPLRRRVEPGKQALLTVWVSPCGSRKGEEVKLLRNGHPNGTRFLSRACTARFVPRIHRGTTFVAAIAAEHGYEAGESRRVTIRLAHRRRSRQH